MDEVEDPVEVGDVVQRRARHHRVDRLRRPVVLEPDPVVAGFVRGLPYGNRADPGDNSSDNPSVELNRKGGKGSGNKGVLIPAAFGAILFVGAFQLRWLMRTIDQPVIPPIS